MSNATTTGVAQSHGASRRVVAVAAFATGAIVANLYYVQPLADTLATTLGAANSTIGLVITLIQVGYAVGLATLVPLGDVLERRRLLAIMLSLTVLGLVVMALAPSVAVLGAAAVLVGATSVAAQIIVPFAAHLAATNEQGRVVSTVMSGLLIGILVSRTVSGLIASVAGWRAVFGIAAAITAAVAVLLWRELPVLAPLHAARYPQLLASVITIVREEPMLRLRIFYGAMVFASFSVFWASAAFLLARPPYDFSDAAIGIFALVGAGGALAARFSGSLADRGFANAVTGSFLAIMALSYLLMDVGETSIWALGAGVAVMDLACQAVHISNQSVVFGLRPQARSRINTAYMTSYFIAGATGSGLSAVLVYPRFGWPGVCVLGAVFPAAGTLVWLIELVRRRRNLTAAPQGVTR